MGYPIVPSHRLRRQDIFCRKKMIFQTIFLAPTPFSLYSVRMNSMIDAQSDTAALAIVAPEEFYTDENGPTHEDFAQPDYDGPADDSHMYPDDVEQDELPW